MARPITLEKPLKAKERSRLQNNGEVKASSHAPSHAPPAPPNNDNSYERKMSSKSADGHDEHRNNSASRRLHSASAAEKHAALDKILNSADAGTDVDTGNSVFVHDEERQRSNAVPSSTRNTR